MTMLSPSEIAERQRQAANTRGILAMIVSMGSFAASDTCLKVAGSTLPVGEIMMLRGAMASVIVIAIGLAIGAFAGWRIALQPRAVGVLTLRTIGEIGATIMFLSGLVRLPFAEVTAIGQCAPLVMTAAGALFLAEPVGWRRWLATLVGFIGVLIIVKPGTAAFSWPAMFILGSVLFITLRDLMTRQLDKSITTVMIVTVSAVSVSFSSLLLLPFETWVIPSWSEVLILFGSAVGVLGGYGGVIVAMRSGEVGVVAPFRYSVIIFSVILGYLVFGEILSLSTLLGIAIVVAAGVYTFHRERVRAAEATRSLAKR